MNDKKGQNKMERYLNDSRWNDYEIYDDYEETNIKRQLKTIRKSNAKKRTQERRNARHKQEQRYAASIAMMNN